jgi:hypothetical protein
VDDLNELESGVVVVVCFLQRRGEAAGGEMGRRFASVVDECVDSLWIKRGKGVKEVHRVEGRKLGGEEGCGDGRPGQNHRRLAAASAGLRRGIR